MTEEQAITAGRTSDVTQARSVAAGRGMAWISEAWQLFTKAPMVWIVNFIILVVIMLVLAFIPIINLLTNLLGPVFAAGLMLGARELDRGGELQISHLFAGFSHRSGALVGLGAINMLLIFLITVLGMGLLMGSMGGGLDPMAASTGGSMGMQDDPLAMAAMPVLSLLLVLALLMPVIMLVWFAPALIALNDNISVFEAMKLSFSACLKNIIPFLLYGIILTVLGVLAAIPFGLGLLVLFPLVYASIYVSYKDIFE